MIDFGTNYGSAIEAALLAGFVGIVAITILVALKETK